MRQAHSAIHLIIVLLGVTLAAGCTKSSSKKKGVKKSGSGDTAGSDDSGSDTYGGTSDGYGGLGGSDDDTGSGTYGDDGITSGSSTSGSSTGITSGYTGGYTSGYTGGYTGGYTDGYTTSTTDRDETDAERRRRLDRENRERNQDTDTDRPDTRTITQREREETRRQRVTRGKPLREKIGADQRIPGQPNTDVFAPAVAKAQLKKMGINQNYLNDAPSAQFTRKANTTELHMQIDWPRVRTQANTKPAATFSIKAWKRPTNDKSQGAPLIGIIDMDIKKSSTDTKTIQCLTETNAMRGQEKRVVWCDD